MSDDGSEEEYVVESIVTARVGRNNRKKAWLYLVKWDGYGEDEKTWEPFESFEGSEHFIYNFWDRTPTGGRDYNEIDSFREGEEFLPIGPPAGRKKRKRVSSNNAEHATSRQIEDVSPSMTPRSGGVAAGTSRKRDGNISNIERRSQPKKKRSPSFEMSTPMPQPSRQDSSPRKRLNRRQSSSEVPPSEEELTIPDPLFSDPVAQDTGNIGPPNRNKVPIRTSQAGKLAAHRARAANPKVKMLDFDNSAVIGGALSVKARLLAKSQAKEVNGPSGSTSAFRATSARNVSPTKSKNSSSLLVFDKTKGKLKTKKGVYKPSIITANSDVSVDSLFDAEPNEVETFQLEDNSVATAAVPSGPELLEMAGLNAEDSAGLDDFPNEEPALTAEVQVDKPASSFLTLSPSAELGTAGSVWKRPTIFGPLGSGSDAKLLTMAQVGTRQAFSLSVQPASFNDLSLVLVGGSSQVSEVVRAKCDAPGKFYGPESFRSLMSALRAEGSGARASLSEEATDIQKRNYQRFLDHLRAQEVFIVSSGSKVLVFCDACISRDNGNAHLLHISPDFLDYSEGVLVTRVTIQDYTKYANIVCDATSVPW